MKTTALVAALGLGTAAVADANFGLQEVVDDNSSITIDLVRADTAGKLAIYDYTGGEFGNLLGTADLTAGANSDVKVTLDANVASELAAVIYEGELTNPTLASNWMELNISDEN